MDPDEAHYAQLTREMLRAGSWLVPLLDGVPYIDKPVLYHWLQGASMWLLGESEFAARLPSAIAAIGLFALTRWVGVALFGAAIGEWGAVMFATIPATFALASIGMMDMIYTMFLFGAVGCLLVAAREPRPRVEVAGYALLALAVMTKGPVALVLVGLFCCAAWIAGGEVRARRWPALEIRPVARRDRRGAVVRLMYVHFGDAFIQWYVLAGNLLRDAAGVLLGPRGEPYASTRAPSPAVSSRGARSSVGRLADLTLRRRSAPPMSTDEEAALALVVRRDRVLLPLPGSSLDHYIFPAAPVLCLIAAKTWQDATVAEGASLVLHPPRG